MIQPMVGQSSVRLWLLPITLMICVSAVPVFAQEKPGTTVRRYNGPGSCSASACHGGAQIAAKTTRDQTRTHIWQNEYFIWATQDPHFKAFTTLQADRSKKISQLLNRSTSPEQDPQCLGCHALAPQRPMQARLFAPEGVSCENCHDASSAWFENHFQRDSTTAKSIEFGMYPIRDSVQRSTKCLSCHMGTEKYDVDHQMIAAGHPDLFFELDLFSAKMPRHWATPNELNQDFKDVAKDPNYEVRLWAVGQAVQLHTALDRLAWRAERAQHPAPGQLPKWPELSELDCFSCHHSVNSNWLDPNYDRFAANSHPRSFDSWRQKRGYEGRDPGSPPWNSAHFTIFRVLLKIIDREDSENLKTKLHDLYQVASKLNSSPKDVGQKAQDAARFAAGLVEKVANEFKNTSSESKKPILRQIMLEISAEADSIANQDTRSAEQAYMALDSLFRSYDGIKTGERLDTGAHRYVGSAIEALYKQFDNPSAYDAPDFAKALRNIHNALLSDVAVKQPSQGGITRKLQVRQPYSAN